MRIRKQMLRRDPGYLLNPLPVLNGPRRPCDVREINPFRSPGFIPRGESDPVRVLHTEITRQDLAHWPWTIAKKAPRMWSGRLTSGGPQSLARTMANLVTSSYLTASPHTKVIG